MNPFLRALFRSVLVAMASAALALQVLGQQDPGRPVAPGPTPPGAFHGPGTPGGPPTLAPGSAPVPGFTPGVPFPGGPGTISPQPTALPKYLEGVITLAEFQALIRFQLQVNDDAASKELQTRINAMKLQLQQLQAELSKHRSTALSENPEMKAINDKMQAAMLTQMSVPFAPATAGPGSPMPGPAGPRPPAGGPVPPAPKP